METVESGGTELSKSSISRRNALKAGVATGVGAAAFAGPQIGMLGMTPAYAAACSQPFVTVAIGDCRNTSCPNACDVAGVKNVSYSADSVSGGGASATTVGGCGNAGSATLTAPASTGQCRLRIDVYSKNPACAAGLGAAGSDFVTSAFSSSIAGGSSGSVTLPSVVCASFGVSSIFYRMTIECSGDDDVNCT